MFFSSQSMISVLVYFFVLCGIISTGCDPSDPMASDDSTFITGTAMVVDGGAYAGRPWHRQSELMTGQGPIKLYRPEGR